LKDSRNEKFIIFFIEYLIIDYFNKSSLHIFKNGSKKLPGETGKKKRHIDTL